MTTTMNYLEAICHGEAWPQTRGGFVEYKDGKPYAACIVGGAMLAIGKEPFASQGSTWPNAGLYDFVKCPKCHRREAISYIVACHLGIADAHKNTVPCIDTGDGDGRYTRRQTVEWLLTLSQFEGYANPYEVVAAPVEVSLDTEVETYA